MGRIGRRASAYPKECVFTVQGPMLCVLCVMWGPHSGGSHLGGGGGGLIWGGGSLIQGGLIHLLITDHIQLSCAAVLRFLALTLSCEHSGP